MKKFLNDPDLFVRQALMGFGAVHADWLDVRLDPTYVVRKSPPSQHKVAVISGGGSGHEPLHIGFVGHGMLDAACPGEVFTSPSPDQMIAAANAVDMGQGILFVVKNFAGDVLNFQLASDMLECPTAVVLVDDDVSVEYSSHSTGRRGVAGTLVVEKVVGAAAEAGADLLACKALGTRANKWTASMGVAFSSCTEPGARAPTFEIGPEEMEMGVGIHGEPGASRDRIQSADVIVQRLLDAVIADLAPPRGAEVLLHVNGFGATPMMELYLLYHCAHAQLQRMGLRPERSLVGSYTTSLDMAGASLTVTVLDSELKSLWDAPVRCPALHW